MGSVGVVICWGLGTGCAEGKACKVGGRSNKKWVNMITRFTSLQIPTSGTNCSTSLLKFQIHTIREYTLLQECTPRRETTNSGARLTARIARDGREVEANWVAKRLQWPVCECAGVHFQPLIHSNFLHSPSGVGEPVGHLRQCHPSLNRQHLFVAFAGVGAAPVLLDPADQNGGVSQRGRAV